MTGGILKHVNSAPTAPRRLLRWAKQRKVAVLVGAWALVVTVLAFATPSVTVREQVTAVEALHDIDAAAGDVAGLLAGRPYSYSIGGLTLDDPCDITAVRAGEEYSRTVRIYTPEEDLMAVAEDLIDKLGDQYPLRRVGTADGALRYLGENHGYVGFELFARDNLITWRATTGCRPVGDPIGRIDPVFRPPSEIGSVLSALEVDDPRWNRAEASCGDLGGPGGRVETVTGTGTVPGEADIDLSGFVDRLPPEASLLLARPDLVTYRMADTSWSLTLDDRLVTVSSTIDCTG